MAKKANKEMIKIELTPEQRDQVRKATGLKTGAAVELNPEELEERVAPDAGSMSVIQNIKG
jgi:hypothetical protein